MSLISVPGRLGILEFDILAYSYAEIVGKGKYRKNNSG